MTALLLYLAAINLAAFAAMGWDKACAVRGDRRISERTLLSLAAAGGAFGAVAAQQAFRHKTRKQPFGAYLSAVTILEASALVLLTIRA
ncbi:MULTISPECIES: DUF1294 domain-containing protein [Phenylobacterium]|uniref:Uncharacterized membrane protein YsdA (DUF1294 family) n=1 Tax=Phenylobacterium koreense TaxID=266125 RepID=A0ABV2EF68_9CAUL